MTNEEWQQWWDGEWQRQRLVIQKWQPPQQPRPEPPKRDTWDPVYGYCFDPEKLKEFYAANPVTYVGEFRRNRPFPKTPALQPALPGHDEMRNRMASASALDSKLPRAIPAAGNAVAAGVGWAIGGVIMAALLFLGLLPCIGFIVACFIFLPLPGVIIGLLIWGVCAAESASTRSIIREELKQHERNLKE